MELRLAALGYTLSHPSRKVKRLPGRFISCKRINSVFFSGFQIKLMDIKDTEVRIQNYRNTAYQNNTATLTQMECTRENSFSATE